MHDPKFEKAVQDKMEQLEFIPSDSVWENIEIAVAPHRRRRAVPVFFWFLLAGLLLTGAGAAIYLRTDSHPVAKNASVPVGANTEKNTPISAGAQSVTHTPAVTDQIKDVPGMPGAGTAFSAGSAAKQSVAGTKGSAGTAGGEFSAGGGRGRTEYRHPDAGHTADATESDAMGSAIDAAPATGMAPATGAASATGAARQHS